MRYNENNIHPISRIRVEQQFSAFLAVYTHSGGVVFLRILRTTPNWDGLGVSKRGT